MVHVSHTKGMFPTHGVCFIVKIFQKIIVKFFPKVTPSTIPSTTPSTALSTHHSLNHPLQNQQNTCCIWRMFHTQWACFSHMGHVGHVRNMPMFGKHDPCLGNMTHVWKTMPWCLLMTLDDSWCLVMTLDDSWCLLMTLDDSWWLLMK